MIYVKYIANILNGEKLKACLLRSGIRKGHPLLPLLFSIIFCLRVIRQDKEIGKRKTYYLQTI